MYRSRDYSYSYQGPSSSTSHDYYDLYGDGTDHKRFYKQKTFKVASVTLLIVCALGLTYRHTLGANSSSSGANLPVVDKDGKFNGRYPNSLLTLFYPFTLLRDVVLDQPIPESDVPFFWYVHKSDEIIGKRVLTECYGLKLVELNDLEAVKKARDINLVSKLGREHVVTSPFIRETCEIFTMDNFGRMFTFFRHPLDYDLVPSLPTFSRKDNWLTRLLSNDHDKTIDFKELGIAKKVVYVTTVVGTIDLMIESFTRFGKYFGWKFVSGKDEDCITDLVTQYNPSETYIDHDSPEWQTFYNNNRYDCQLYEQAQSTWRAQIQTVIPLEVQLKRAEPEEEEEEEEEDGGGDGR